MITEGEVYTDKRGVFLRIDQISDGRIHYTTIRHRQRGRVGSTGSKSITTFMIWKSGGPVAIDPLWEWVKSRDETKRPIRNIVLPGTGRSFPAVEIKKETGVVKLIVHRADEMIETLTFDETGARIDSQVTAPEGRLESQL